MSFSCGSSWTTGQLQMPRMRIAKSSVRKVSGVASLLDEAGAMSVLQWPPRLEIRSFVSFESRNGTCCGPAPRVAASESPRMTLPSVYRLLLMWPASLRLWPSEPVALGRSEPAKSTSEIEPKVAPPGWHSPGAPAVGGTFSASTKTVTPSTTSCCLRAAAEQPSGDRPYCPSCSSGPRTAGATRAACSPKTMRRKMLWIYSGRDFLI